MWKSRRWSAASRKAFANEIALAEVTICNSPNCGSPNAGLHVTQKFKQRYREAMEEIAVTATLKIRDTERSRRIPRKTSKPGSRPSGRCSHPDGCPQNL